MAMEQNFSCRRLGLAAAVAMFAAAAPAQAQYSKSDAIIGAPSQLAAIMAAQASGAAIQVAAAFPAQFLIRRPVFFTAPAAEPTDFRASPTRPDIFNSIAMPIAHSPLDGRWQRVASAAVHGRAASYAAALRTRDELGRLEAVNSFVNARVAFTNDIRQFGVADRWSNANETLARGRGDCEDYALAKLAMLRRAGIADRDLYFVVLKDVARRADHAVLVVRSGGRFLVLDNGTDRLVDSAALRDYRPVLTFTQGQRFTHGYRRAMTVPVVLASNTIGERRWSANGMPASAFAAR